jgi:hypothetical protein
MSDFRSLLSSFQAATGAPIKNQAKTSSLNESIADLWRQSQLQKSFTSSRQIATNKKQDSTTRPIHIAICAVIVSALPHEPIWRSWLENKKDASASIYIHAKTPSAIQNDSWLKSKLIPISHNPNWNDVRVVAAMLSLIEYASKDEKTTHIMFVTESCIPITTLDALATFLRTNGSYSHNGERLFCSFMDAYSRDSPRCTRFDEHSCFQIKNIPSDAIYKALPGWCLLSRKHATQVLALPESFGGKDLYPLFEKVWAPEEVFFPTALSLVGVLPGEEVVGKSIMFAKWDERARGQERAHPLVYDGSFSRALVLKAREQGCFFMRKFKRAVDVRDWETMISVQVDSSSQEQGTSKKRPRDEDAEDITQSSGKNNCRTR